jgi:streptomycin 3"-adenylyltransferase
MSASLPADLTPQLAVATAVLEQHLAGSLKSIRVFGSAVEGDLKRFSDLDLMVMVSEPLSPTVRLALMQGLLAVSAWPGTHPARRELQFGEWLRADIQAGTVKLAVVDGIADCQGQTLARKFVKARRSDPAQVLDCLITA